MRVNKRAFALSMLFLLWTMAVPFSVAEETAVLAREETASAFDEIEQETFGEAEASASDDEALSTGAEAAILDADDAALPGVEAAVSDDEAFSTDAEAADEEIVCQPVEERYEEEELDLTADEDALDGIFPLDGGLYYAESEERTAYSTLGLDNDEAVNGYINRQLYAGTRLGSMPLMAASATARSRMADGTPQSRLYDALKPWIIQVAAGEVTDTAFQIPVTQIYDQVRYSAEELGVAALVEDGAITPDARDAYNAAVLLDLSNVLNALMVDMPYEMFWYDKTLGTSYTTLRLSSDGKVIYFLEDATLTYKFKVAAEYSATGTSNTLNTDQSGIASIGKAVDNARGIVERYSDYNDIAKLRAYKDEICARATYNHAAAEGGVSYGNPWQLIWVFDGNEETSVVCEGYAKAFKYLCDLSDFRQEDISVICAFGNMYNDSNSGGGHMWNIVTYKGVNYMADLTNCDEGTVGYPDKLFLVGYSDISSGEQYAGGVLYYFDTGNRKLRYVYDAKFVKLFNANDYTLTNDVEGLKESVPFSGTTGSLRWSLDDFGVLYIEGEGVMPDYTEQNPAPWCAEAIRLLVEKVVLEEGVTSLGDRAFYGCSNLVQVRLSESVQVFGSDVFEGCGTSAESARGIVVSSCENAAAMAYARAQMQAGLSRYDVTHARIVTDEAVAPTCTESGLTEGRHCDACGEIIEARQVVPATGHTAEIIPAVAPTYTSTGLTDGTRCSVCGEIIEAQQVVPMLEAPSQEETPAADEQPDATQEETTAAVEQPVAPASAPASAPATAPVIVPVQQPDYTLHVVKNTSHSMEKGTPLRIVVDGKTVKSFKSSNKKVATITKDGWVTAKKAGTAKITATLKNKKKITVKLKVTDPYLPKSVRLVQGKSVTVQVGQTLSLQAVLSPETAVSSLKWKSGNKKIATVNGQGVVTAKKAGKVKITVTTANKKKAVITVRVVK